MSASSGVALAIAIIAEVVGTSAITATHGFTRLWPSLLTIVAYGVAFYALSLALEDVPVGIAYAIWGGVGIVLVSLAGWILYGQRLDWPAILGIALIVAGVLVVNLLSASVRHG